MPVPSTPEEIKAIALNALNPYLGNYEILDGNDDIIGTPVALWSAPPEVPSNYRVVNGLEAVLIKNPDIQTKEHYTLTLFSRRTWTITLIDHSNLPDKTLQQAGEALASVFMGAKQSMQNRILLERGEVYPQMRVTFPQQARLR